MDYLNGFAIMGTVEVKHVICYVSNLFTHSINPGVEFFFDLNIQKRLLLRHKTNIQKFDLQPLMKFLKGRKTALTFALIVDELPYQASKLSRSHISA